jgi:hypothetical protein
VKLQHLAVACILVVTFAGSGCDDYDAYPGGVQSAAQVSGVPCIMPADMDMDSGANDTGDGDVAPGDGTTVALDPFWGAESYDPQGAPPILPPSGHHMAMTDVSVAVSCFPARSMCITFIPFLSVPAYRRPTAILPL